MKRLVPALIVGIHMSVPLLLQGAETVENILTNPPYKSQEMGKRVLVDEKHLLLMQVALQPGQSVPQHTANSNVHIIIMEGEVRMILGGKETLVKKGDLVPVAYKTLMSIKNESQSNATFVIIKTPNPTQMKE